MKFIIYSILSLGVAATVVTTNTQSSPLPIEEVSVVKITNTRVMSYKTTLQPECPHVTSVKFTQTEIAEGRPEHCHTCSMGVYVQQVESEEYRCSYCNSLK
jgi:DNA-directed RNA polymerase subunit RPC12/RpoP